MTTRTKQVSAAIAIVGVIFAGGIFYNESTSEVIDPGALPALTFEAQDSCLATDVTRLRTVEGLSFWKEPWYTVNDIQSEIAFEFRVNGSSDRYMQLLELLSQVEAWLDSAEFSNGCSERQEADISIVDNKEEQKSDVRPSLKAVTVE